MNAKRLTEIGIKKCIRSINALRKQRDMAKSRITDDKVSSTDVVILSARLKEKYEHLKDLRQTYDLMIKFEQQAK
jgi:hypothetical protein